MKYQSRFPGYPDMTLDEIRDKARRYSFRPLLRYLPLPLCSEFSRLISFDSNSSTLADLFEDARDKILSWCDFQESIRATGESDLTHVEGDGHHPDPSCSESQAPERDLQVTAIAEVA